MMEILKLIVSGAVIATLFSINAAMLLGVGAGLPWIIVFALSVWMLYFKNPKEARKLIFKSSSIMSFFLPVSALVNAFVFAGNAISQSSTEAEQAGAAIGSVVGGGLIVGMSIVIGFSLGVVFYLLGRK